MRKRIILLLVALPVVAVLTSCSYGPKGAFPAQVGEFKLKGNPKNYREFKQKVAIYEAPNGLQIAHMISEDAKDEAGAKQVFESVIKQGVDTFEQGPKFDKAGKQVGIRLAQKSPYFPGVEQLTTIYWTNGRWFCSIGCKDRQKALEFEKNLPY